MLSLVRLIELLGIFSFCCFPDKSISFLSVLSELDFSLLVYLGETKSFFLSSTIKSIFLVLFDLSGNLGPESERDINYFITYILSGIGEALLIKHLN